MKIKKTGFFGTNKKPKNKEIRNPYNNWRIWVSAMLLTMIIGYLVVIFSPINMDSQYSLYNFWPVWILLVLLLGCFVTTLTFYIIRIIKFKKQKQQKLITK